MKQLVKKLIKVANSLDAKGEHTLASDVDSLVKNIIVAEWPTELFTGQPMHHSAIVGNLARGAYSLDADADEHFETLRDMIENFSYLSSKQLISSDVDKNLQANIKYTIQAAKRFKANTKALANMITKIHQSLGF